MKEITIDGHTFQKSPSRLENGNSSEIIRLLQERINLAPLTAVEKLELSSMLSTIVARSIAFDVDSYVKKMLIDKLKDTDLHLMKYETDLMITQERLSELEKNIQFHKQVLADMKEQYMLTKEPSLLGEIDKREEQIQKFNSQLTNMLDLRNKIRKEMDKKNYSEAAIKLKEKELAPKTIDLHKDMDYSILEG